MHHIERPNLLVETLNRVAHRKSYTIERLSTPVLGAYCIVQCVHKDCITHLLRTLRVGWCGRSRPPVMLMVTALLSGVLSAPPDVAKVRQHSFARIAETRSPQLSVKNNFVETLNDVANPTRCRPSLNAARSIVPCIPPCLRKCLFAPTFCTGAIICHLCAHLTRHTLQVSTS